MTKEKLALLPPKTLISTTDLCAALSVNARTLRRMVTCGKLPPPIRIGGSNVWFAGAVIQHWECMAAEKADAARRKAQYIAQAMK